MSDDLVKRERRMDAYWYDFKNTNVDAVDKILSAVAWAGKAYHNTSEWYEECDARDDHTGNYPVEWIANAAKEAANRIEQLEARVLLLEGWLNGSLNIIEVFVAADTTEARAALGEKKDD